MEFLGYLKDALHIGRVIFITVIAVVFWLIWQDWTAMIVWFSLSVGIILADAIYEYVQVRVRKRVVRRRQGNHA